MSLAACPCFGLLSVCLVLVASTEHTMVARQTLPPERAIKDARMRVQHFFVCRHNLFRVRKKKKDTVHWDGSLP